MVRLYLADGSNVDLCRRADIESGRSIVRPGTAGADLSASFKTARTKSLRYKELLRGTIQLVAPSEWVLYKPRWDAFYGTKLEEFLKSLEINTLIFTGCNFPNCPRTSMYEASERDFKLVVPKDAISGIYRRGIDEAKNIGAAIFSTDKLVRKMKASW